MSAIQFLRRDIAKSRFITTDGLEFSIAKTKAMIFSRQKEPPTPTSNNNNSATNGG
jgi:hypothetical protein